MAVASETIDGKVEGTKVPASEWAWAKCSAATPFPGTPDPTQICLKNGFDPALAYRVTFTAQDPYVLGVGFAAFRDVASFFKTATQDAEGTPNPLAGADHLGDLARPLAVGQLPARIPAFRLQRRHRRAQGARRRLADHRRRPDLAQHALCDARRHVEAVRGRQRGARVVGAEARPACAVCRRKACSAAAWPRTPARRSSSTWARPKSGASS